MSKTKNSSGNMGDRPFGPPESYQAPKPPKDGRIVAIDCHPDIFTLAVMKGQTPHDAEVLQIKQDIELPELYRWAERTLDASDLILMEAGSNSFTIAEHFRNIGLRACVLESGWVGKQAKNYVDNDKMAAERIGRVFLQGNAPAVWQPDAITRQRRELLHLHLSAVSERTRATNQLKSYLNQHTIRPGNRNLVLEKNHKWILQQREWSSAELFVLNTYIESLTSTAERCDAIRREIHIAVLSDPLMLALMSLLGIAQINAFALIAIIGDIGRFDNPKKLASYLGLNPSKKTSGKGKEVKIGVGRRGRKDMRNLLIQAAQAILRQGNKTDLGKWGMGLFLRKGNRNIAVVAVARKLAIQVWRLLKGNRPDLLVSNKSRTLKFEKTLVFLGRQRRLDLGYSAPVKEIARQLDEQLNSLRNLQLAA